MIIQTIVSEKQTHLDTKVDELKQETLSENHNVGNYCISLLQQLVLLNNTRPLSSACRGLDHETKCQGRYLCM